MHARASTRQATDEKNKAVSKAEETQQRADLAQRLVRGLADEKVRWTDSIAGFAVEQSQLVGNLVLGAAFVSYIGAPHHPMQLIHAHAAHAQTHERTHARQNACADVAGAFSAPFRKALVEDQWMPDLVHATHPCTNPRIHARIHTSMDRTGEAAAADEG